MSLIPATRAFHVVCVALLLALTPAGQAGMDVRAVADVMLQRLALQRGERVLLVGVPGRFEELIAAVRERVRRAGALDLGVLAASGEGPTAWETSFTRAAKGRERGALAIQLAEVDAAIMMPGAAATHLPYAAMQDVLKSGRGRTVHFHWEGAYAMDGAPLPVTPAITAVYDSALRFTDYSALAASQRRFEQAARNAEIRVRTPAGTDLWFRLGERAMTRQDGDASAARARQARVLIDREIELPAGAIRVAPLEQTVSGRIAFPDAEWGGERAEGVTMTFVRGRVTRIDAKSGREAVERTLTQAGDGGRSFREFALGFNPLLAIPVQGERWIPYYGYGAGVVRLSLGDNSELGGQVGGGWLRWNFFTDATVIVGNETWVRDGVLLR